MPHKTGVLYMPYNLNKVSCGKVWWKSAQKSCIKSSNQACCQRYACVYLNQSLIKTFFSNCCYVVHLYWRPLEESFVFVPV